jgi:hypothetical protein
MENEIVEIKPNQAMTLQQNSPAAIMMQAMQNGTSIETVEKMMDLQFKWERNEAEKAFNVAFSAFKAEAVKIIKGKKVNDGPLKGRSYAELHDVVNAVTPALSKHGLGASWKVTKDDPTWIEVTCTIKHIGGHSDSVSLGGPPDAGGAKNAIQARASTVTYLERYTLKAITGLAESDDDTDGATGGNDGHLADWLSSVDAAQNESELRKVRREGGESFTKRKDVPGYAKFAAAITKRAGELKGVQS